ncbi:hypothetical protein A0256_20620 [Mucilaginibacter sp. PAMC 26640]|nr:hypothetical protein A0256_20620 [Mucilaginibacter sp. PAMC 26640]
MEENGKDSFIAEEKEYLRNVVVDNVIFGYHDKELKVLLQRPFATGKWTITGGYIKKTETIDQAAARVALSRTGLKDLYLQQFKSFGDPEKRRDADFNPKQLSQLFGVALADDYWIFDYFVSIGFYTLTEFAEVTVLKGEYESECEWWLVKDLPLMMFDHQFLIDEALRALRIHIAHYPIGYELLPGKFTLPEIQSLYETILGKTLDNRNFAKKMMVAGILVKLNETKPIGAHRSPFLYSFDKDKYNEALKDGLMGGF